MDISGGGAGDMGSPMLRMHPPGSAQSHQRQVMGQHSSQNPLLEAGKEVSLPKRCSVFNRPKLQLTPKASIFPSAK